MYLYAHERQFRTKILSALGQWQKSVNGIPKFNVTAGFAKRGGFHLIPVAIMDGGADTLLLAQPNEEQDPTGFSEKTGLSALCANRNHFDNSFATPEGRANVLVEVACRDICRESPGVCITPDLVFCVVDEENNDAPVPLESRQSNKEGTVDLDEELPVRPGWSPDPIIQAGIDSGVFMLKGNYPATLQLDWLVYTGPLENGVAFATDIERGLPNVVPGKPDTDVVFNPVVLSQMLINCPFADHENTLPTQVTMLAGYEAKTGVIVNSDMTGEGGDIFMLQSESSEAVLCPTKGGLSSTEVATTTHRFKRVSVPYYKAMLSQIRSTADPRKRGINFVNTLGSTSNEANLWSLATVMTGRPIHRVKVTFSQTPRMDASEFLSRQRRVNTRNNLPFPIFNLPVLGMDPLLRATDKEFEAEAMRKLVPFRNFLFMYFCGEFTPQYVVLRGMMQQMYWGLVLPEWADVSPPQMLLLSGSLGTGKSSFLRALLKIFGTIAFNVDKNDIESKFNDVFGEHLVNIMDDVNVFECPSFDEYFLKEVQSKNGERMVVRRKHAPFKGKEDMRTGGNRRMLGAANPTNDGVNRGSIVQKRVYYHGLDGHGSIRRLIEIHSNDGLCPSKEELSEFQGLCEWKGGAVVRMWFRSMMPDTNTPKPTSFPPPLPSMLAWMHTPSQKCVVEMFWHRVLLNLRCPPGSSEAEWKMVRSCIVFDINERSSGRVTRDFRWPCDSYPGGFFPYEIFVRLFRKFLKEQFPLKAKDVTEETSTNLFKMETTRIFGQNANFVLKLPVGHTIINVPLLAPSPWTKGLCDFMYGLQTDGVKLKFIYLGGPLVDIRKSFTKGRFGPFADPEQLFPPSNDHESKRILRRRAIELACECLGDCDCGGKDWDNAILRAQLEANNYCDDQAQGGLHSTVVTDKLEGLDPIRNLRVAESDYKETQTWNTTHADSQPLDSQSLHASAGYHNPHQTTFGALSSSSSELESSSLEDHRGTTRPPTGEQLESEEYMGLIPSDDDRDQRPTQGTKRSFGAFNPGDEPGPHRRPQARDTPDTLTNAEQDREALEADRQTKRARLEAASEFVDDEAEVEAAQADDDDVAVVDGSDTEPYFDSNLM
jgi:hypothetical protein